MLLELPRRALVCLGDDVVVTRLASDQDRAPMNFITVRLISAASS